MSRSHSTSAAVLDTVDTFRTFRDGASRAHAIEAHSRLSVSARHAMLVKAVFGMTRTLLALIFTPRAEEIFVAHVTSLSLALHPGVRRVRGRQTIRGHATSTRRSSRREEKTEGFVLESRSNPGRPTPLGVITRSAAERESRRPR